MLLRQVGKELDRRSRRVVWEAFHTVGESTTCGTSAPLEWIGGKRSCCS